VLLPLGCLDPKLRKLLPTDKNTANSQECHLSSSKRFTESVYRHIFFIDDSESSINESVKKRAHQQGIKGA